MFELKKISFSYENKIKILSDFNLTIKQGEKVALTGDNGTGKTTIFEIMVGLLTPNRGEIFFEKIKRQIEKDFYDVRKKTGYLFQEIDNQLFCPTVQEELAFGLFNIGKSRDEITQIIKDTLNKVGLKNFDNRITYKLSTGEKRLVAFAAVYAMSPKFLLLDEPTAGLDKNAKEKLTLLLKKSNKTMLIISHDNLFLDSIVNRKIEVKLSI